MMRKILMILLWLVLLGGGFVFYWIQDANRFKPELETVIQEQAGVPLKINGDLAWRLFPPLSLTARTITTELEGQSWSIGELALDLDLMTIIRTRDVDRWRVQALTLTDVTMTDDAGRLDVASLEVDGFALATPAPVSTTLTYTATGSEPVPLELEGLVTYYTDPERYVITDADFVTTVGAGTCNAEATPVSGAKPAPPAREEDLIPVEVWRSFDWQGDCALNHLTLEDQRFENATVDLTNKAAVSQTVVNIPEFFGGNATATIGIDAHADPVRWTLTPELQGVDSQRLMAWLDQRLKWIAPLAYGGTLRFEGNSTPELLTSLSGETRFDGGQGAIDITAIKQPLLAVATLLREPEKITRWPDLWEYERFVGDWRVDRQRHTMTMALDNLTMAANGDYDPLGDDMNMLAELTFKTLPEGKMFDVNSLLMDVPIPIRCRGSLEAPNCGMDEKTTQKLVASVLASEGGRAKLEKKIEEDVPEEYQDAARGILDMLGGALKSKPQDQ